jgi:hypothetical protein
MAKSPGQPPLSLATIIATVTFGIRYDVLPPDPIAKALADLAQ